MNIKFVKPLSLLLIASSLFTTSKSFAVAPQIDPNLVKLLVVKVGPRAPQTYGQMTWREAKAKCEAIALRSIGLQVVCSFNKQEYVIDSLQVLVNGQESLSDSGITQDQANKICTTQINKQIDQPVSCLFNGVQFMQNLPNSPLLPTPTPGGVPVVVVVPTVAPTMTAINTIAPTGTSTVAPTATSTNVSISTATPTKTAVANPTSTQPSALPSPSPTSSTTPTVTPTGIVCTVDFTKLMNSVKILKSIGDFVKEIAQSENVDLTEFSDYVDEQLTTLADGLLSLQKSCTGNKLINNFVFACLSKGVSVKQEANKIVSTATANPLSLTKSLKTFRKHILRNVTSLNKKTISIRKQLKIKNGSVSRR